MNYSKVSIYYNNLLNNKIIKNIFIITAAWFLIRLVIYVITDFSNTYGGDSGYYISVGKNIVNDGIHGIFSSSLESIVPTSYRPPLYSLFVGLFMSISESSFFIFASQSVISLLLSISCYMILREENNVLALLAAILIALSPSDALYNGRILSENIVTPLLVLSSMFFVFSKSIKGYLFSGVVVGATVLTRDVYILLPFIFIFFGFISKIPTKYLLIYLLGFAIIVTPWVMRNVNLDNNGGAYVSKGIMWSNIWSGTWIRDHNDVISKDNIPKKALSTFDPSLSDEEFLAIWKDRGNYEVFFKDTTINYILNNPLQVLDAWVSRYHLLWMGTRSDLFNFNWERYSVGWYTIKLILYLINTIIVLTSIIGFYFAIKSKNKILLLFTPVIYSALIYVPFYNIETRYTQPIYPILMIFVSFFIVTIRNKYFNKA